MVPEMGQVPVVVNARSLELEDDVECLDEGHSLGQTLPWTGSQDLGQGQALQAYLPRLEDGMVHAEV